MTGWWLILSKLLRVKKLYSHSEGMWINHQGIPSQQLGNNAELHYKSAKKRDENVIGKKWNPRAKNKFHIVWKKYVQHIHTFNPTEKSEVSFLSLFMQTTGRSVDRITVRSCNKLHKGELNVEFATHIQNNTLFIKWKEQ